MVLSRSATTSTPSPVASVAAKTNPPSLLSSAAAAIATTPDSLKALLVCTTRCNTGWPAGVNLYAFIVPSDSGVTSIT